MSEEQAQRLQRCLAILQTVASEKGVNRKTLAQRYRCSVRTIANDVALLKQAGFELRYTPNGYTLAAVNLQIPPLPLNQAQILALFIGARLLTLTPLERNATQAVHQVLKSLSAGDREFLRNLTDRIYIAPGGEIGEAKILLQVYQAVAECQSIRIHYQSFSHHQEVVRDVNPYGIYLKDRTTSYLIGRYFCGDSGIRRFKLCRIRKVIFLGWGFQYPPNFSLRREMAKGFWSGDASQEVVLRFTPAVAQLVREREPPEHLEPQPDGSLLLRKTVRHAKEVLWEILSYEANVEVVTPPELREMVKASIEQMRQVYENGLDLQRQW